MVNERPPRRIPLAPDCIEPPKDDWRHRLWLWVRHHRLGARDVVMIVLVGCCLLFTAEYENHTQAATRQQQATERAVGCRQFGALVESIVQANAATQHAVTASKSFGELFSEAVQRYYGQTGCSRYFAVTDRRPHP